MVHNKELNSDLERLVASIFNVLVERLWEADKSPYYHIGLSNKNLCLLVGQALISCEENNNKN